MPYYGFEWNIFLNKRLIRTAVYVSEHYKITEKAAHKWFSYREQMQRSLNVERFGAERIHNIDNIVALPKSLHRKISGFYSSKQWWTKGVRVRDWLTNQTFEEQYNFGIKTIEDFDGKAYLK